ncbi:TIGR04255 family protein [Pantoea sp. JGM49]|uniref:TIGR04255 family protein n=1 Tax=Pantoea sp. JGM49 TaxID=2799791 RepID=UPI001BA4EAA7|nr:TIGR04255 family protein [Pantoea sp. JGM49]MBS0880170.1 TIGR04255 family protein [Pantoea sp. JGM49]
MNENLVYVLAKVQFGRITESRFKERADAVQEALRKEYPIVNTNNTFTTFQFDIVNSGDKQVQQSTEKIINICSPNRDWGIRISHSFLMLHTKSYAGFENFSERMSNILNIVEKEFELYHSSFVGFRFINKFPHDESHDFNKVFRKKEFVQPDLDLEGVLKAGSNLSAHYVSESNNVMINSGVSIGGPKIPAEFADLPNDLGLKVGEVHDGVWAHLDIDSFYGEPDKLNDFSVEDISNKYSALRKLANEAYAQIVYAKPAE